MSASINYSILKKAYEQFSRDYKNNEPADVFEWVDHMEFFAKLDRVFSQEHISDESLINKLNKFLNTRWAYLNQSNLSYDLAYDYPLNKFCFELARLIDENHSLHTLMPTVNTNIDDPYNANYYRDDIKFEYLPQEKFGNFFVYDDGSKFCNIQNMLNKAVIKAYHEKQTVFKKFADFDFSHRDLDHLFTLIPDMKKFSHLIEAGILDENSKTVFDAICDLRNEAKKSISRFEKDESAGLDKGIYIAIVNFYEIFSHLSPGQQDQVNYCFSTRSANNLKSVFNKLFRDNSESNEPCLAGLMQNLTKIVNLYPQTLKSIPLIDVEKVDALMRMKTKIEDQLNHPASFTKQPVNPDKLYENIRGHQNKSTDFFANARHENNVRARYKSIKFKKVEDYLNVKFTKPTDAQTLFLKFVLYILNEIKRLDSTDHADKTKRAYIDCFHQLFTKIPLLRNSDPAKEQLLQMGRDIKSIAQIKSDSGNVLLFSSYPLENYKKFLGSLDSLLEKNGLNKDSILGNDKQEVVPSTLTAQVN